MNGEQLQDFLTDLSKTYIRLGSRDDLEVTKKFLDKWAHNTMLCANYITINYRDVDLVQPLVAQILALYYRGGILRQYALQFIPSFIGTYLYALSKKQQKSVAVFEVFFLAVYNEEILERGSELESLVKKTTVRVGPYPTIESFTSQSKFLILTRIMKSVNSSVVYMATDVVCRHVCLAAISISESGFSFPGTNFVCKVMDSEQSCEVIEDHSKKPRQQVNSNLLLELLTGVYMAFFNGAPDIAIRAIDAVHQRAQYEILAEVVLVTSAIRNSLLESPLSKEKRDELLCSRNSNMEKRRKGLVTTASLRIRKMPEDIPVQPELKEKEHPSLLEEGSQIFLTVTGMDNLKRRVSALGLHHRIHRNRKCSVEADDVTLLVFKLRMSLNFYY
ncbi:hypothetical protein DICVIV_01809 [Dictyocaulus viviparus]|uniref:Hyccin n=1 Tax=Dictyocaulus viviparus TaxID=29172 RepID=A0A0D8Y551_DICVI|nr:hypothetical protein DICVIV_01809 [Dictyocaulus viviparus]